MGVEVFKINNGASSGLQLLDNANLSSVLTSVTDKTNTPSPLSLSLNSGLFGVAYGLGFFENTNFVFNNYANVDNLTDKISVFAASQANLNGVYAYGGAFFGYTNGTAESGGLISYGKVTNTNDTATAYGLIGLSIDTHAGGINTAIYAEATGGASNFALWLESGDIKQSNDLLWRVAFGKNLSFFASTNTATTGTFSNFVFSTVITPSASGNANINQVSNNYDIVSSGTQTGTINGFSLNANEVILGGFTHNLMNLKVNGDTKFKVNNAGAISIGNTVSAGVAVASTHKVLVSINGVNYYLLASNI